jgi:hypothetical protein
MNTEDNCGELATAIFTEESGREGNKGYEKEKEGIYIC